MIDIASVIDRALDRAIEANPATLVHGANTYTVFRSYGPQTELLMVGVGYDPNEADLTVLLRVSDIVGNGPARNDVVTLDSVTYYVHTPITKTPRYWMIPLKPRE